MPLGQFLSTKEPLGYCNLFFIQIVEIIFRG